jgi:hypothetical protein
MPRAEVAVLDGAPIATLHIEVAPAGYGGSVTH